MTLLFLDHSFHQKTRSTFFLQEAWSQAGWTVVNLWDEEWQGGAGVSVEAVRAHRPDVLLSFQVLKPARFYRATGCPRILLVPMYDSSGGMKPWDWWEYRHFSFLHFSSTLLKRLERLGIPGSHLQYFPNPEGFASLPWDDRTGGVFYWQRVEDLPFASVARYLRAVLEPGIHRLHWHHAVDPGEAPLPVEASGLDVTRSHWFPDPQELRRLLTQQKVFIAPRLAEGIGMSFLEAMAMGCVVIAHDDATMNEYIVDGENGLLVDWRIPRVSAKPRLDLQAMGANARRTMESGYRRYRKNLDSIVHQWEGLFSPRWRLTWAGGLAAALYGLRHFVLRPLKRLINKKVA